MREKLWAVAQQLGAPGRGILAADESAGTIKKRFDAVGVESTPETRRDYRELLFRSSGMDHISGVILFDETIRQVAADGTPLREIITNAGALVGIKVDRGTKPLAGFPGETVTEGLDGLRERLQEYAELGASFAKWRSVITIGKDFPTPEGTDVNMRDLTRYAALCQEAGIVPIVEPEVLMDGDHNIGTCEQVTAMVLRRLFEEIRRMHVSLEGIVLKPNMIIPGKNCPEQATPEEVAQRTLSVFSCFVPAAVPSIAFLSGGQSDVQATANLNAMNKAGTHPWALSFSYGRALQAAPQKAWGGRTENVKAAQAAFSHRALMNALASEGHWAPALEG